MRRVVLASANPAKVAELEGLLADRFDLLPRPADAPETIEDQDTLIGNAVKKAREIASFANTLALADDTGLFVDSLGGAPGVFSARYAGPACDPVANMEKLLAELDGVELRSAHFETVIALVWPDGRQITASGLVDGEIRTEPIGKYGFGYDPVFVPDGVDGRTYAQMTKEEKSTISHRAEALAALVRQLAKAGLGASES